LVGKGLLYVIYKASKSNGEIKIKLKKKSIQVHQKREYQPSIIIIFTLVLELLRKGGRSSKQERQAPNLASKGSPFHVQDTKTHIRFILLGPKKMEHTHTQTMIFFDLVMQGWWN